MLQALNKIFWKNISFPDEQQLRHWTVPVVGGHVAGLTNFGFDSAVYRLPIVELGDLSDSWLRTSSRFVPGIRV